MATKLKTERFVFKYDQQRSEEVGLDFKVDIQVSQNGLFYCYLPDDVVKAIEKAGLEVSRNYSRSNGKKGYYSASSYDGLVKQFSNDCQNSCTKKRIARKIVIRYAIQTVCSYMIDKNKQFVPNGTFVGENYKWLGGTLDTSAISPAPFGFSIYTKVEYKDEFVYASGLKKTEYHNFDDDEFAADKPMLEWLDGIVCNAVPNGIDELSELDYSEDVAGFFVSTYKALFKINEGIKNMIKPEQILALIENKQKLLS